MPNVLFLCVQNAGRSQMAAGFMRKFSGGLVNVSSGGSEPAELVNPVAVAAMAEKGVSISDQRPERWTVHSLEVADVVVTMGCGDTCPVIPGKRYVDWVVDDPSGGSLREVRVIRDDIERRVMLLRADLVRSDH